MTRTNQAAGLQNPLQNVFPQPIVSNRAPTSNDRNYPLGQEWVNRSAKDVYILADVAAGVATWNLAASTAGELNTLDGDSGSATPTAGAITLAGGTNLTTSATGSTVTTSLDASITLTTVNATTFDTNVAAAAVTLAGTTLAADGTDADIGIAITPKGTGVVTVASGGVTVTAGDFTATAGDFIASTAGTGVTLGGGARVVCGTGDPNTVVTAPQGSLYLTLDGSSTSTRAYINTDSATAWTAITTAT